jgi:tetraacyldisaccharide 4'-kinase
MKTPRFWYDDTVHIPLWTRVLAPVYAALRLLHTHITTPIRPSVRTICIGNITAGGSGKTPLIKTLVPYLPVPGTVILTRGYKGREKGPLIVQLDQHTAADVGDEAIELARGTRIPVVVSKDRRKGIDWIIAHLAPKIVLMDDGLQNPSIKPHINIAVIDGKMGFGNERLIPAGPLREHLNHVWPRLDSVIIVGDDVRHITSDVPRHIPVFSASAQTDISTLDPAKPAIAFAGIGWPDKFFDQLQGQGIDVVHTFSFPDHHTYTKDDIDMILKTAEEKGAQIVTTEKDAVKLPEAYLNHIHALPLHLSIKEISALVSRILGNKEE